MEPDAYLEKYPFLAQLSMPSRDALRARMLTREVPPRTHLIQRGQEVGGVYLVGAGALRVYYIDASGREGTLYWVEPGESCVLAVNAVFSRLAYPAWVDSDADATRFAVIPGDVYRELHAREEAVRDFTFSSLSGRVLELMQLVEQTATFSQEQRLAALLLRRADDAANVALTQEVLARHLGTAREVVSRVLRGLAARGLVRTSRGAVKLLDRTRLRHLARGE